MKLNELFKEPYEYEIAYFGSDASAFFYTEDRSRIKVDISKGPEDSIFVAFMRGNDMDVTGEGDAPKIFSTVVKIVKDAVEHIKPTAILFSAMKEGRGTRGRLYRKMAERLKGDDFVVLKDFNELKDGELSKFLNGESRRAGDQYDIVVVVKKQRLTS